MARRDITGAVDFKHLETFAGGDLAVVEEVLAMFPEQAELWVRLLDPAGPAESWRDGAHALKGAALGLGAFPLAEACSRAETETGAGRKVVQLDAIRDALNAALSDIAAYTHELALRSLRSPGR